MQIFHGTYVHLLPEIIEYGALLCPLDVSVERVFKNQGKLGLSRSKEEIEARLWDGWESNKSYAPDPERQAYIYVSPTPFGAFQRVESWGIILGFDYPANEIPRFMVWRRIPLDFMTEVLYMDRTDIESARKHLFGLSVEISHYDPRQR